MLCLLQLLKTQDELERLRADRQTLSSDAVNELRDHNTSLISRAYDIHFTPVTSIFLTHGLF